MKTTLPPPKQTNRQKRPKKPTSGKKTSSISREEYFERKITAETFQIQTT